MSYALCPAVLQRRSDNMHIGYASIRCCVSSQKVNQEGVFVEKNPYRQTVGYAAHAKNQELSVAQAELQHAQFTGARQGLGAALHTQLAENIVDMFLHRTGCNDELVRNFPIGPASVDKPQNL